ncbi:MAG: bifunctional folylpolyglutamate synthase/dihydrofolate synthase [Acidobacteria bacterium]|nr:bifunctional folylpolyglutamate synthase/dihydrofolate synthase [Acidobacteriota bacterium]
MDFRTAENYLYSLGNEVETMKLGLENIRTLLAAIGNPQNNYKKVQVAGTNGKGSVCAFLDSICVRAGIKTGLYTSPHLVSITERVKVDGADINEEDFGRLATRVREASEKLVGEGRLEHVPTFFEQVTAIALLAFAEAKVELAILETGLGGRFDAVTAANAEITAITRIDLDHQEYLGDTIEKIAAEKAAIIRADSKVVLTHQKKNIERVLTGRCREVGVKLIWASADVRINDEPAIVPVLSGSITTAKAHYSLLEFWNMLGRHQFENASVAVGVAEVLQNEGYGITNTDISLGLETAEHPGRLEYFEGFLLDGAHNVGGARALTDFLDDFVTQPITLVFGAMKEKNVAEIAGLLFPRAEKIVLTQPENSRAMTAEQLTAFVPSHVHADSIFQTESVTEALDKAKNVKSPNGIVLVTGSLYLIGEVKRILKAERAV